MKSCQQKVSCPCEDSGLGNYSAEAPDKDVFLGFSTGAVATVPQPGTPFDNPTGYNFCESEESQEAADLCAANGAIENNADNGNPSTPPGNTANDGGNWSRTLYQNSEQSCTVDCPNGGQFTYVVPAGTVTDLNPTIVDRAAASLACKNANKFLICIGPLDNTGGCLGVGYFGTVVLTGSFAPYSWVAVTPLPTGLILDDASGGGPTLSKTVGIIGTPTAAGPQSFTLRATDSQGHFAERTFTLTVLAFTNSPTAATVGTPYSFQFTMTGGTAPYSFSALASSLPSGLTMSSSGLITGTPSSSTPATFSVTATDSLAHGCAKSFTVTPVAANRLRIQGYVSGMFVSQTFMSLPDDPPWDGNFANYNGTNYATPTGDFSIPAIGPDATDNISVIGEPPGSATEIGKDLPLPGFWYLQIATEQNRAALYIGPVSTGPPNGLYTYAGSSFPMPTFPATLTIEFF